MGKMPGTRGEKRAPSKGPGGMIKKNKGQIVRKIAKKKYLQANARGKKKRMQVTRLRAKILCRLGHDSKRAIQYENRNKF